MRDLSVFGTPPDGEIATLLGTGQKDKDTLRRVREGEYRLVYVTEVFLFGKDRSDGTEWLYELHRRGQVLMIAVDEAQNIVEGGERTDYRPDYARLGELRRVLDTVPVLALSAPATPAMWTQMTSSLGLVAPVHPCPSMPFHALPCPSIDALP